MKHPQKHAKRNLQMQQSEMLDLRASPLTAEFPDGCVDSALSCFNAFVLGQTLSNRVKNLAIVYIAYLNAFACACHSLPSSILILTHLYISSVPP